MWKTTDRYVQQKRLKAVEAESKLKQVYIPNYTKPNAALLNNSSITATTKSGLSILNGSSNGNSNNDVIAYNCGKPCESCNTVQSQQVFHWFGRILSQRLFIIIHALIQTDFDEKKIHPFLNFSINRN